MSDVRERIKKLRLYMRERRIDAYLVPTSDYHDSEYVGEHFACRRFITGFTGSAGTALITQNWAGLWTDGRYYIQAEAELAGSGIMLMKEGMAGVPTVGEFIEQDLPNYGTLGFDGRVISAKMGEELEQRLQKRHITLASTEDLIGEIWEDRPRISMEPIWILKDCYAGRSASEKIEELRSDMRKKQADVHILTSLDDIAWLLNIRGNDIACNPVALCYAAVTPDRFYLFINLRKITEETEIYLRSLGVTPAPYQEIYTFAAELRKKSILLEKSKVNYAIVHSLDPSNHIIDSMNPVTLRKMCKNPTEIENMKKAHIKDGVVMTKFIYWLKHHIGKTSITECTAAEKLDSMRREAGALDLSFETISAYGPNAAMCHYHAEPANCAELQPQGLYLVDSGGQYPEGTTDVTRTIALGPVSDAEREHYTLVLLGMLRLSRAKFMSGCSGEALDLIAREPLWRRGLDYNHGTGHGVGFVLNVHERPVTIRYRQSAAGVRPVAFAPGMICSDEPGFYLEGSHGIRTENLLLCTEGEKTEFGQFLRFEMLTCVPIDLEPVNTALMEPWDIVTLNLYHADVYEKISPWLTKEEAEWLREVTAPIGVNDENEK